VGSSVTVTRLDAVRRVHPPDGVALGTTAGVVTPGADVTSGRR
jgi:hypothetical protein